MFKKLLSLIFKNNQPENRSNPLLSTSPDYFSATDSLPTESSDEALSFYTNLNLNEPSNFLLRYQSYYPNYHPQAIELSKKNSKKSVKNHQPQDFDFSNEPLASAKRATDCDPTLSDLSEFAFQMEEDIKGLTKKIDTTSSAPSTSPDLNKSARISSEATLKNFFSTQRKR